MKDIFIYYNLLESGKDIFNEKYLICKNNNYNYIFWYKTFQEK